MTVDNRGVTILGYTYDASGRLVAAKTGAYTTLYTNDGLGQRVTRSGYGASGIAGDLERFVYDEAGQLLGEYDGAGKAIEETVWLGDLPVAVLIPGKLPYYIAPDQLGAPHQIASAARSTVWRWDHDPFGNGAPAGSLAYNLRFPGQYYDKETGLDHNGYRDYDPSTGRYIESDPIGLAGGLNTYAYVGGNPTGGIDPAGLQELSTGVEYDELAAGPSGTDEFSSNTDTSSCPATTGGGQFDFSINGPLGIFGPGIKNLTDPFFDLAIAETALAGPLGPEAAAAGNELAVAAQSGLTAAQRLAANRLSGAAFEAANIIKNTIRFPSLNKTATFRNPRYLV